MAGKIMRLNVISSFKVMFRSRESVVGVVGQQQDIDAPSSGSAPATAEITREQLEDREFVQETMRRNESFLSSLPILIQYWKRRKSDLFAMMRQLGKPTVFLTLSASEIFWIPLLKTVFRYQQRIEDDEAIDDATMMEMSQAERAALVNSEIIARKE